MTTARRLPQEAVVTPIVASSSPRAVPAVMGATCLLLVLCAGLLPVWALAVQTPFRLIDDYGPWFYLWDRSVRDHVSSNLSLEANEIRFRPTHHLGQLLAFSLFGGDYRAHHALRLLMKALAFAALLAVAVRHVEGSVGGKLGRLERLVAAALAFSLFFYFPNNPEARLSPQELPTVMYLMGCLFFVTRRAAGAAKPVDDALGLFCFVLALWSKEPNVIPGAALLALVVVENDAGRGRRSPPSVLLLLGYVLVWVHAALKVTVMSIGGGYGRPPLEGSAFLGMAREVPRQVMLGASAWWIPALFAAGLASFARLGIARSASRALRLRSALLLCLLLAAVAQYLLLWSPVLRYAYPAASLQVLLTVIGFGLLLARAPTSAARQRRTLATAGLALAFALTTYRDMTTQFSAQYVAGRTEGAALDLVERLMATEPTRSFFVVTESEYDARIRIYFNRHLPSFFGRATWIGLRRTPAEVPVGAYWVTRRGEAAGFDRVVQVSPPPQPRVVAISAMLSRIPRLGRPGPEPLLDAGAPPLSPESWFVLRRTAGETVGGQASAVAPPAPGPGAGSGPAPAR